MDAKFVAEKYEEIIFSSVINYQNEDEYSWFKESWKIIPKGEERTWYDKPPIYLACSDARRTDSFREDSV